MFTTAIQVPSFYRWSRFG